MGYKLTVLDKKILYFLDADCRTSLSKLSKRVKASQQSLLYRIKRLRAAGIIKRYVAIVDLNKVGLFGTEIYYQFQNLSPEGEKTIIDFFLKDERVIWISKCHGKFDLIIAMVSEDIFGLDSFQKEVLSRFGKFILNKAFVIQTRLHHLTKDYLWKEDKKDAFQKIFPSKEVKLDATDSKLLFFISQDARSSIKDLSKKMATPPNTVSYHIKRLINAGVLAGFRIDIDLNKLGLQRHHLLIKLNESSSKKREQEFIKFCEAHPSISYLVECIGEWEYGIEVDTENVTELSRILLELRKLFGDIIKGTESLQLFEEPKNNYWPKQS